MPAAEKIKILVTGFGSFPGHHSNPSEKLLGWIEQWHIRPGPNVDLRTELIPTSWRAVETFTSGTLAEFDPDIALHFGVHSRAAGICVEKRASNCTCTQADATGKVAPRYCVRENSPQTLNSTIETHKLVIRLRARGLPARSSTHAGRYLCNALLFSSLCQSRMRATPRQTSFIHIPELNAQGMGKNALLKTVQIAISHCVGRHIHKKLISGEKGG